MARVSFTEHPATVGESYGRHLIYAFGFGGRMIVGSLALLVHAVLPFLFTHTGSTIVTSLYDQMITNRARLGELRHKSDI